MRLLIGVLALLPLLAAAETGYVTDTLTLGLHRAADTSDRPFRNLQSGQEFEILSRDRFYANVQLPDGTTGWVKTAYIVSDKPAKLIVAETAAERDRLAAELAEVRAAFAEPEAAMNALRTESAELRAQLERSNARVTELEEQNEDYKSRLAQFDNVVPLSWVGGAILICLIGGILLGLWWVDRQSRKRHGGIRIY
jgi:SH3 domain protein